jgi:acyl carrier protein
MTRPAPEEVEQKLACKIAAILSLEPDKVQADQPLQALGIDQASLMEILEFIDKAFGLRILEFSLTREDLRTVR